jgi:hypothetical protein
MPDTLPKSGKNGNVHCRGQHCRQPLCPQLAQAGFVAQPSGAVDAF